jgi:hypothetical protein
MTIILAILIKIKNFIFKYWKQLLLVALGAFLVFKAQGCEKKLFPSKKPVSGPSSPTTGPVLKPDQKEIITVNTNKKTITVTTPTGTKTVDDSHGATIIENKNGTITVNTKKLGFEAKPYIGVGIAHGFRTQLGLDYFYFHRFDAGFGVETDCQHFQNTAADLNLSYNFYSNTSIAVSYNTAKQVGVFLKVRF